MSKSRIQPPKRRPLKIFAVDPMQGKNAHNVITIDVPNEPLQVGPAGSRIRVIDFDGAAKTYYEPVDLNDPNLLIQNGIEPSESDPRFHQQMVYAVVSKVLENFELALGRRLNFKNNRPIKVLPHAFIGANAYYDPKSIALLFGYFTASRENVGANLPGQIVFSCLSHDIIAHETTHALMDRLRRYFSEPTNRDVMAFHEAFADIVAIFQHFSFIDIVRDSVQQSRTNLREANSLVSLAQQFGYATGKGAALRNAADKEPDSSLYATQFEPHERGSILVAAVFDGFFKTYQARIKRLVRVATGGTGILPAGDLHPDLVELIATEASACAHSVLLMCIRAIDYLPPIDVTFGDFLRALVTADYEVSSQDDYLQRASMIEAFREWGIFPDGVFSLAEESLIWPNYITDQAQLGPFPIERLGDLIVREAAEWSSSPFDFNIRSQHEKRSQQFGKSDVVGEGLSEDVAKALHDYAKNNARALGLDPTKKISVHGFHPVFRSAPHGQIIVELIALYTQKDDNETGDFGGLPVRGGVTVIVSAEGTVKYVISKSLPSGSDSEAAHAMAVERIQRQQRFVRESDQYNLAVTWLNESEYRNRMANQFTFAALHRGL